MYNKTDDLRSLIESLSFGEKKYFREYVRSQNYQRIPLYVQLYELITSSKSEVSLSFKGASKQAYTNAKRRLYKNLLECLFSFHKEKSLEIIIQNLLGKIEILYDHGLAEQGVVLLKKAHSKAITCENYGLLLQVLAWERKLNIVLARPTRTSSTIVEEEKRILENFNQIVELENIYSKVKELKKRYGYVKGAARLKLEKITMSNPYLQQHYKDSSQRGIHYYHFIYSLYHWMIFDHRRAYEHSKKLLVPEMRQMAPNQYIEGILEHATSCLCLGRFNELLITLQMADTFLQQKKHSHSKSLVMRIFYVSACYKLMMYSYMGAIEELREAISITEKQITVDDQQLPLEMKLVIYENLRNAYIASGAFEKAEQLMNVMLQKDERLIRNDVYNDLFLFRLFTFLQSETYILIPAFALSAFRHFQQLKSNEMQLEVELKITSVLMKDCDYTNQHTKKTVLLKIKEILVNHIALLKGLNSFHEYYSFYIIWTDSMMQNQAFHMTAANWHTKHLSHLE